MPGKFRRLGVRVPLTSSEREAHDVARTVLERGALLIGTEFVRDDDDWEPAWLILTGERGTIISPGRGVEKYQAVAYVAALARRWGAVAIGHVHSSWMVTEPAAIQTATERNGDTDGLPRDEILLLATYTAGNARQYTAAIHRQPGHPPALGPFEQIADTTVEDGLHVQGAMVDPLLAALTRVG